MWSDKLRAKISHCEVQAGTCKASARFVRILTPLQLGEIFSEEAFIFSWPCLFYELFLSFLHFSYKSYESYPMEKLMHKIEQRSKNLGLASLVWNLRIVSPFFWVTARDPSRSNFRCSPLGTFKASLRGLFWFDLGLLNSHENSNHFVLFSFHFQILH